MLKYFTCIYISIFVNINILLDIFFNYLKILICRFIIQNITYIHAHNIYNLKCIINNNNRGNK